LTKDAAVTLAAYNVWADKELRTAIQAMVTNGSIGRPGVADYDRRRKRVHVNSALIIETLHDDYQLELMCRAGLQGSLENWRPPSELSLPRLRQVLGWQARMNQWYVSWSTRQTEQSLLVEIRLDYGWGPVIRITRGEMFMHILNQKTYSRGRVSERFFGGISPAPTELDRFLNAAHEPRVASYRRPRKAGPNAVLSPLR